MTHRIPTGFWPLQVGGWLAFAAAMSLGRVGEFTALVIVLTEWPFALFGFITTLFMQRVFVRLQPATTSSVRVLSLIALVSYVGGMLWTASFHTYLHQVAVHLIPNASAEGQLLFRRRPMLDNTVYNTMTLLAWSTLYVGLSYREALFEQRARALRAVAEARDAQLQMLAYQLNPHFLFNTLNSLRAMIDEDRDRARLMVTALARFLRYALVERPLHLARLSEEVEALSGYLSIESIRFEDRLDVRMHVEPAAMDCLVPAFLLNPLVENAIKHGAPSAEGGPLRVSINARINPPGTLSLIVENSGLLNPDSRPTAIAEDDLAALSGGGGLGLRNVRTRLHHHFPNRHRLTIEQDRQQVRVAVEMPAMRSESDLQITGFDELRLLDAGLRSESAFMKGS